jgi:hypothetical protein
MCWSGDDRAILVGHWLAGIFLLSPGRIGQASIDPDMESGKRNKKSRSGIAASSVPAETAAAEPC